MICQPCGKVFIPKHPRGRFCSPRCRATAWQQRQAQAQVDRDANIRLHVREAMGRLNEALRLLEPESGQKEP